VKPMSKLFGFGLLWWLTGNPFTALLILLIILYVLERRFVGLSPSLTRPIRIRRRLRKIRQELALNPHHNSLKTEAARLLIEMKRYGEAKRLLDDVLRQVDDSAELRVDAAISRLKQGELAEGEALMLEALKMNPRVRYGEPYLRLAEAFADHDREKALGYLQTFSSLQSSSCEGYYRLGVLLAKAGKPEQASQAFREALDAYRSLPRYKKRSERRWALLARLKR